MSEKEDDLDTDKLKKRLVEIENIINNLDNHKKNFNFNSKQIKKDYNNDIIKRKSIQNNEKSKLNDNSTKEKLVIETPETNISKFHSDKSLNKIDSNFINKKDHQIIENKNCNEYSKLYTNNRIDKDNISDSIIVNNHTNLITEFSENYKGNVEKYSNDNRGTENLDSKIDVIESSNIYLRNFMFFLRHLYVFLKK